MREAHADRVFFHWSFHTFIEEFVGLLQSAGVRFLVDVRTVPRSRRNAQFNREVLPAKLADFRSSMSTSRLSAASADISATSLPQ
jgi:uncharacterized protein (DUF488 family)